MSTDVLMVGYLFCDALFRGLPSLPVLGQEIFAKQLELRAGGAFNTAVPFVRLGLDVALAADIGNDIFSSFILSEIEKANIQTNLLRVWSKPLPPITAILSFPEDRSFVTFMPSEIDARIFGPDLLDATQVRHVYLGGLKEGLAALELAKKAKRVGIPVSLDCQWHPALMTHPALSELLECVDIFVLNELEAMTMTGAPNPETALGKLAGKAPIVVIKLGAKGAMAQKGSMVYKQSALKIEAVETTGAGDCFNAGFIYGFINGKSTEECLAYGNICGGLSTATIGGAKNSPTKAQLDDWMNRLGLESIERRST